MPLRWLVRRHSPPYPLGRGYPFNRGPSHCSPRFSPTPGVKTTAGGLLLHYSLLSSFLKTSRQKFLEILTTRTMVTFRVPSRSPSPDPGAPPAPERAETDDPPNLQVSKTTSVWFFTVLMPPPSRSRVVPGSGRLPEPPLIPRRRAHGYYSLAM